MTARTTALRDVPPEPGGRYVLYWMVAARGASWNFALDRAVDWARQLGKPLLVLEASRCDYRWGSNRLHPFAVEGRDANSYSGIFLGARLLRTALARAVRLRHHPAHDLGQHGAQAAGQGVQQPAIGEQAFHEVVARPVSYSPSSRGGASPT